MFFFTEEECQTIQKYSTSSSTFTSKFDVDALMNSIKSDHHQRLQELDLKPIRR